LVTLEITKRRYFIEKRALNWASYFFNIYDMNEKTAVEMLKNVKKSFDEHDVLFWLRDGTVLGAVRDKKFIDWDTDIDIATWSKDFDKLKLVQEDMNNLGYETLLHTNEIPYSLNIVKDDCNMDIASYDLTNGNVSTIYVEPKGVFGQFLNYMLWVLNLRVENKLGRISNEVTRKFINLSKEIPVPVRNFLIKYIDKVYHKFGVYHYTKTTLGHFFTNLSKINFYGMMINVPKEKEKYLEYRYGEKWMLPQRRSPIEGLKDGVTLK